MSITMLPIVSTCTVEGCSYNHDADCHAGAITVSGGSAACATYVHLDAKAGMDGSTASVGACHRADCIHNDDLECSAPGITVGPGADTADCLTFTTAS